jgi:hypothetical protein
MAVSEIEQRLRAAMRVAVAGEQPPARLLEMVRLRHRRHRARAAWTTAGAAVVAAAAVALGFQAGALRAAPGRTGRAPAGVKVVAPSAGSRNVLDNCAMQTSAGLGPDWQRQSMRAGPVWLVGLRDESATAVKGGTARIGGLLVMVRNGVTARVTVTGQADGYFRFLFGPGDFTKGLDGRYTIDDGESGVTFASCPGGAATTYLSGFTQYGGYFLITVPQQCVSLDVSTATSGTPARVTFGVNGARCPHS